MASAGCSQAVPSRRKLHAVVPIEAHPCVFQKLPVCKLSCYILGPRTQPLVSQQATLQSCFCSCLLVADQEESVTTHTCDMPKIRSCGKIYISEPNWQQITKHAVGNTSVTKIMAMSEHALGLRQPLNSMVGPRSLRQVPKLLAAHLDILPLF